MANPDGFTDSPVQGVTVLSVTDSGAIADPDSETLAESSTAPVPPPDDSEDNPTVGFTDANIFQFSPSVNPVVNPAGFVTPPSESDVMVASVASDTAGAINDAESSGASAPSAGNDGSQDNQFDSSAEQDYDNFFS